MQISQRAASLRTSTTIAVTNLARELRRQGQDVLSFAAGEPDFDTPEPIKKAAIDALLAGQTKYMQTLGDPETRAVVAHKVTRENGLPNVTADHVAISSGGKHALYVCFQCLLDPPGAGRDVQEVLLPVPTWVSYQPLAELAGGKIVELPTTAETSFKISPRQLRAAITPRSRLLVLNSPSNPCGTMYTPDELRALAAVVAEAARTTAPELVILTDEMYEKIVYGGIPHFSIGSIAEVAERTITLNGLSKAFAMTGWRVGYAAASGEFGLKFMKAMATMQGQMTTNITSFVYPAIRVALTQCADSVERMRRAFAHRAEVIFARVGRIPGLPCVRPTGAFYLFPSIAGHFGKRSKGERTINTCGDFCEALLTENKIAAVPGDDFGGVGKDHVRFSFACSEEQINKGMDRLGEFVAGLR